jgi:hypothetical protein
MSNARGIMAIEGVKLVETVRTHGGLRFNLTVPISKKTGGIHPRGGLRRPRTLRVDEEDLVR